MSMSMPDTRCCHIRLDGGRCTMPALNHQDFCFNHERLRMRARNKPCPPPSTHWTSAPLFDLRYPETREDVIDNLHSALDAFTRHMIDYRQLSAVGKQMDLILRTMREGRRENEKLSRQQEEPPITRVRYEADGNPIACRDGECNAQPISAEPLAADSQPPVAEAAFETATEAAIETVIDAPQPATISSLSAEAEEPVNPAPNPTPNPAKLRRIHNPDTLSDLFLTLTQSGQLRHLFSNTYEFRAGKLTIIPPRAAVRAASRQRRPATCLFLTNMR